MEKVAERLLGLAEQLRSEHWKDEKLTDDEKANALVSDLENYPHAFVLACIMDRRVKAEKAWSIPERVQKELGGKFDLQTLSNVTMSEYKDMFKNSEPPFHYINDAMAEYFLSGVQRIIQNYKSDASNIWKGKPSSATVVYRFLQFDGVGIKIATMAVNLLVRLFDIPLKDYYSIDISPDTHIQRVFRRTGLVEPNADVDQILYKAREISPEFPGLLDPACFQLGRDYCHARNPLCENEDEVERKKCPLCEDCPKQIEEKPKQKKTRKKKRK